MITVRFFILYLGQRDSVPWPKVKRDKKGAFHFSLKCVFPWLIQMIKGLINEVWLEDVKSIDAKMAINDWIHTKTLFYS